jgi:hypothetical protein
MRRGKKRGPARVAAREGFPELPCRVGPLMGLYPPRRPCFYGDYHNFD